MTRNRVLFAGAAVLTAAALLLPLWGFTMSAPQYPDESLHLRVERTGIVGDVHEITTLQQYVGVRFPTALPELEWTARALVALAVLLTIGALVPRDGVSRAYRLACATLLLLFLAASAAVVQARLYEVGHRRDPNAPLRAIGNFTPPLLGPAQVGNFTVWSYPHEGGVALLIAAGLAVAGTWRSRVRGGQRTRPAKRPAGRAVA